MNKTTKVIAVGLIAIMFSICATVFGGKVTQYQKTKPGPGETQREVRVGALIADIVVFGLEQLWILRQERFINPKNKLCITMYKPH